MNTDELETAIRAALRENVEDITAGSMQHDPLREQLGERAPVRSWLFPAMAAAAVVVITIAVSVLVATHRSTDAPSQRAGAGPRDPLRGSWRLVSATAQGHSVDLAASPPIAVTFRSDATVIIADGVNATVASVDYESGAFTARFRSTTYALDGSTDPSRRAALLVLDSLAPSSDPSTSVRSSYRVQGDRLTITTPGGALDLTRTASPSGASGAGGVSGTPSASTPGPVSQS